MRNLILFLLALALHVNAAEQQTPPPSLVQTEALKQGVVNPLQNYVGTLYYDVKSDLASEFEGAVASLHFKEGQHVKKGDILLRLDTAVLESSIQAQSASIDAMKADLTRQERDLERTKALFDRNSISQSEYDLIYFGVERTKAQLQALQSQMKTLQIQKEKMQIKAPFEGIITQRNVDVGEWVSKGAAVATLVDPKSIEARVSVPARFIHALRDHEHFSAAIEQQEFDVAIKSLIPLADTTSRTFMVKLALPETEKFIEGMRIDISIPTLSEAESLMISRDAVIKRFGQNVVFAAVDGKAVMIPVQVIGYNKDQAAISAANLKPQMRIVVKGNERIFPNMPVMEKASK